MSVTKKPKNVILMFSVAFVVNVLLLPILIVALYATFGPEIFSLDGGGYITGGMGFKNDFGWFMLYIFMPFSMAIGFTLTAIYGYKAAVEKNTLLQRFVIGFLTFIAFIISFIIAFWRGLTV